MKNKLTIFAISLLAIVSGFFLITLSFYYGLNTYKFPLLLGFGTSLIIGGIYAILGDLNIMTFLKSQLTPLILQIKEEQLSQVNKHYLEMCEKLDISVNELTNYATYLSQSRDLGITMVYPDRRTALDKFFQYLFSYVDNQSIIDKELVIVSSSMRGIIGVFPDLAKKLENLIKKALLNKCQVHFLLTHPAYSHYRESQESRQQNDISKEILHAISWLESIGLNQDHIRLYKGTPTTFMIASSEKMILNFYPYQTEAYNCFCLELENNGLENSVYKKFYNNHFLKAWEGELETQDHYLQTNSLKYLHQYFDGPISDPKKELNINKWPYGDFFAIDDGGTFYLSINIKNLKSNIVYERSKDGIQKIIKVGNLLNVRLLKLHDQEDDGWKDIGEICINTKDRSGYFETIIENETFSSISMIGIFDTKNENIFLHDSENILLKNQPLPLLYKWLYYK